MQTVKKLKKWVLSSFDSLTDSQHKLVSTSKGIEDEWQRKEYVEDTSVVDAWCKAFREELLFQLDLNSATSSSAGDRKSLSESAMATTLDAAHVLSRTAGPESGRCFAEYEIVPLLTRYLVQSSSTMPRKLRDACGTVLTTITSTHPALLTELLTCVLPHLQVAASPDFQTPPTVSTPRARDAGGDDAIHPPLSGTDTGASFPPLPSFVAPAATRLRVSGLQVQLATLLVMALCKSIAALGPEPPHWLDDAAVLSLAEAHVTCTGHLVGGTSASAVLASVSAQPLSPASTQPTSPAASSLSRAGSPVAGAAIPFATTMTTTNNGINSTNNTSTGGGGGINSSPGESASREDTESVGIVIYTSLVGCLYRGQTEHKQQLLCARSHVVARCWLSAVPRLSRLPRSVNLGLNRETVMLLEPVHFWQSVLVEMILELSTEGCFTQCRLRAFGDSARMGSPGSSAASSTRDLTSAQGPVHSVWGGRARFEPMPAHWDTVLTGGGSPAVWVLAALLPTCPTMNASLPLLQSCLIGLDTSNPYAETVYRSLISSLMLFCAGNPCVASTFAHHGLFDVLIALLTYQQQSVFPSHVAIETYPDDASHPTTASISRSISKEGAHPADADALQRAAHAALSGPAPLRTTQILSPVAQLSSNTAQLTSSFIASLAALSFPTKLLRALMSSVEAMCCRPTCQTDVDLVESLLHVLSTTYMPTHTLFFPGSGSVVCNAHRFVGRWSGYSFSAWINPVCVWPHGSLLFSVTDHVGSTTELLLVANGRTCCLALRLSHRVSSADTYTGPSSTTSSFSTGTAAPATATPPPGLTTSGTPTGPSSGSASSGPATCVVIPGSALPAEAWSHIAFTHGLVDPHVYINGRRLDIPVSLPFPKEASRRHRLQIALGGLIGENSLIGFVARMDVLDGGLSDSDITKLFEAGPAKAAASTDYHTLLSLRCREAARPELVVASPRANVDGAAPEPTPSRVLHRDPSPHEAPTDGADDGQPSTALPGSPVCLSGGLVGKHEGISMHGIIPFVTPDMKAVFAECHVVDWALRVLETALHKPQFATVARLCVCFLTTPMRMAQTMAEREQAIKGGAALDALSRQILMWPDTYADLPSTLLTAVTVPGASSRVLAPHASTQTVITMLLDRLRVVSGELTRGACPADRLTRNPTTTSSILRELSDTLLVHANIELFLSVPQRFLQVLSLSLYLPLECIESVVMLIEKLCKGPEELEATLRFLLATHPQPTAGQAKAEIVRMLFDVSRANPGMCERIAGCFKGTGVQFLLELVHGSNHHSEPIRVYTLRLLSLILYTSKKQREAFLKCEGFALLRLAITDPASLVPIRLPTLDCLFHMAFQSFRPTESIDAALATRLKGTGHNRSLSKLSAGSGGTASAAGGVEDDGSHRSSSRHTVAKGVTSPASMPGHLPGLVSRRLRVVHREFSFEVKRDFAARAAEDRWQSDDAYRGKGIEGSLTLPQALEAALGVIGFLIAQSPAPTAGPALSARDSAMAAVAAPLSSAPPPLLRHRESSTAAAASEGSGVLPLGGLTAQGSSAESTMSEEDRPEDVVLPALGYLEKIVDVTGNAEALVRTNWLWWLWQAVAPVVAQPRASASWPHASAATAGVAVTAVPTAATPTTAAMDGDAFPLTVGAVDDTASPATPSSSSVPTQSPPQTTLTPTSTAPHGTRYARRYTSEVVARTRGIVRRVVTLEMRLSSKSPTVRRVRGALLPPQLVRIVLEESVRYFSRTGQSGLADPDSAVNVVKNVDTLLQDVEELLLPFPATLGIEVVTFISTVAVNSNSWVRMRMKNSSSLFQTRDRFAFFLLCTMRKLSKVRPQQLIQLLDACTCNPNTMVTLLGRLQAALNARDVNELERALLLIRHLIVSDVEQADEMTGLLGARGAGLAEILTMDLAEDNPLRTASDDDGQLTDLGRSASAFSVGTVTAENATLPTLPTAQVVEWRQSHAEDYAAVSERVTAASKDVEAATRAQEEHVAKGRAALARPTRAAEQRHEQEKERLTAEFQRIVAAVQAERGRKIG